MRGPVVAGFSKARRKARAADDTGVLVVPAVVIAPAVERALGEHRLVAGAGNGVHPYRAAALSKESRCLGFQGVRPEELLADHGGILKIPVIVAHRTPLIIVQDLDPAFVGARAVDEAQSTLTIDAWRGRRRLWRWERAG